MAPFIAPKHRPVFILALGGILACVWSGLVLRSLQMKVNRDQSVQMPMKAGDGKPVPHVDVQAMNSAIADIEYLPKEDKAFSTLAEGVNMETLATAAGSAASGAQPSDPVLSMTVETGRGRGKGWVVLDGNLYRSGESLNDGSARVLAVDREGVILIDKEGQKRRIKAPYSPKPEIGQVVGKPGGVK